MAKHGRQLTMTVALAVSILVTACGTVPAPTPIPSASLSPRHMPTRRTAPIQATTTPTAPTKSPTTPAAPIHAATAPIATSMTGPRANADRPGPLRPEPDNGATTIVDVGIHTDPREDTAPTAAGLADITEVHVNEGCWRNMNPDAVACIYLNLDETLLVTEPLPEPCRALAGLRPGLRYRWRRRR